MFPFIPWITALGVCAGLGYGVWFFTKTKSQPANPSMNTLSEVSSYSSPPGTTKAIVTTSNGVSVTTLTVNGQTPYPTSNTMPSDT